MNFPSSPPYARGIKAQIAKAKEHTNSAHTGVHKVLDQYAANYGVIDSLQTFAATKHPADTDATHAKKVFKAATKAKKTVKETAERARAMTAELAAQALRDIEVKVPLKPNEYAAEYRAMFRSLDQKSKISTLTELINTKDFALLGAVLNVPPMLAGITPEMQRDFKHHAYTKHAPDEYAELTALTQLYSEQLDYERAADEAVQAYHDPATLAEIERQEEAARRAQVGFDDMTGTAS